jgi:hypothetical protein
LKINKQTIRVTITQVTGSLQVITEAECTREGDDLAEEPIRLALSEMRAGLGDKPAPDAA